MYIIYFYNEQTFSKGPYHTFANTDGKSLVHGADNKPVLLTIEEAILAVKNNDSLAYTTEEEYREFERICEITIYKLI